MQRSNYLFLNMLQSVVLHSLDINLKFNYLARKIVFCSSSSSFFEVFFSYRHKESVRICDNPRDFPEILNKNLDYACDQYEGSFVVFSSCNIFLS